MTCIFSYAHKNLIFDIFLLWNRIIIFPLHSLNAKERICSLYKSFSNVIRGFRSRTAQKLAIVDVIRAFNWPVRLSVRTPGFHPGKRGSIPLRATIKACKKLFIS